jgi:hypothetical protein
LPATAHCAACALPHAHNSHAQVLKQKLLGPFGLFCSVIPGASFTVHNPSDFVRNNYRQTLDNNVVTFTPLSGVFTGALSNISYQIGVAPPGQPATIFDITNTIGEPPVTSLDEAGPHLSVRRCARRAAGGKSN